MNLVTLLAIVGALVVLVVVIGLALALRDPAATRQRIEGLFRRPEKAARIAGREQYYRPYWSR